MIAGLQKGHERASNGTKSAWQGHCAISPLELSDRLLECARRRSSFAAIGDAFERATGAVDTCLEQGLKGWKDHCRSVIDRGIDDSEILGRIAAGVFENRIEMKAIPACHFICLRIKALPSRHRQEGPRQ